jgi:hypothetical protein
MSSRLLEKLSVIILIALLNLAGCSQPVNKSVDEIVASYYKKFEPANKGELKILAQKSFSDETLVLAEKYSGDGHSYTELFLINQDKVIEKRAEGSTPISMCFSANKINYENGTVIFGNFNPTKWNITTDTKKAVEIQYMAVKFKDGETIKENVDSIKNGYIICSPTQAELVSIELYNALGELQSDLAEIGVAEKREFVEVEEQET